MDSLRIRGRAAYADVARRIGSTLGQAGRIGSALNQAGRIGHALDLFGRSGASDDLLRVLELQGWHCLTVSP